MSSYKYVTVKLNFFGCIRGAVDTAKLLFTCRVIQQRKRHHRCRNPEFPHLSRTLPCFQALVITVSLKRSSKTCHLHRYFLPLRIFMPSEALAHFVLRQAKGGSPPDVPVSTPDRRISLKIATSEKKGLALPSPTCAQYNPSPRPHTNSLHRSISKHITSPSRNPSLPLF